MVRRLTADRKSERIEDTARQRDKRACRRHLQDLVKAYGAPPPDIKVRTTSAPRRIEPPALSSYRTSPAELCSEFGE